MDEASACSGAAESGQRLPPLGVRHLGYAPAEPLDRLDLRARRGIGHHYLTGHAEGARAPRDALGHVARARRVDTGAQVVSAQFRDRVPRAAQLEGADRLKVLEFEIDHGGSVDLKSDERRSGYE